MGIFKSLRDKIEKKKDELQKKAVDRAAEMALQKTKDTARGAITGVSKKIENALFGKDEEEESPDSDAPPSSEAPKKKPDPKAKGKSGSKDAEPAPKREKEKLEHDYDRFVKEREAKAAKLEKEVDDDLAALKKKLKP